MKCEVHWIAWPNPHKVWAFQSATLRNGLYNKDDFAHSDWIIGDYIQLYAYFGRVSIMVSKLNRTRSKLNTIWIIYFGKEKIQKVLLWGRHQTVPLGITSIKLFFLFHMKNRVIWKEQRKFWGIHLNRIFVLWEMGPRPQTDEVRWGKDNWPSTGVRTSFSEVIKVIHYSKLSPHNIFKKYQNEDEVCSSRFGLYICNEEFFKKRIIIFPCWKMKIANCSWMRTHS